MYPGSYRNLEKKVQEVFDKVIKSTLQEESKIARLHNIDYEELMGIFSSPQGRAPIPILCLLSSKIMAQKKKTMKFIDEMDDEKRKSVIVKPVRLARHSRRKKHMAQKGIQSENARREG